MQRRKLIERLVETRQRDKHEAPEPVCGGMVEREAQWHQDEAGDRKQLRRQQAFRMRVELAPGRAGEERETIQHVDRPVGQDRPRPERDARFPGEAYRRHVDALRGRPVRESIGQEEEWGEEGEPRERATPRRMMSPHAYGGHCATRFASDTVKMPDSPMRWATLRPRRRRVHPTPAACADA